jgi:hypothetical protein
MVKKYDSYFTDFNNMVTDHLEEDIKLIYPEIKQECLNCTLDTFVGISKSSGKYKQGGPIPFDQGMPCPYCNGEGHKMIEKTENIPGRIYTSEKPYLKVKNVNIPEGAILFICRLQFFSKIMQAKYMIPVTEIYNYTNELYQLDGQPESVSFVINPVKYISCLWTKNR